MTNSPFRPVNSNKSCRIRRDKSLWEPARLAALIPLTTFCALLIAGCQKSETPPPAPSAQGGSQPARPQNAARPDTSSDDLPPVIKAAQKGDADEVKSLLASGTKVDTKDRFGRTALIIAAGDNDRSTGGPRGGAPPTGDPDALVKLLLSHHADPNAAATDGTTPLLAAFAHKKNISGQFDAAGTENARVTKVQALIAAGANVNKSTPTETADHLRAGSTPLMAAASNGDPLLIKLLLTKGAEVNAKDQSGYTALMNAAHLGKADVVQLLIANHADVNARNAQGGTALSEASRLKSSGLVKCQDLLRSAGAKG